MISIKQLAETRGDLTSIPTAYNFCTLNNDIHLPVVSDELYEDSVPTIDFSLLTSGTPEQRSKIVNDLGKACRDWGFLVVIIKYDIAVVLARVLLSTCIGFKVDDDYQVINHGVPESLMKDVMIETCGEFSNCRRRRSRNMQGRTFWTQFFMALALMVQRPKVLFWRDFIKFFVHPKFHCPTKPTGLREISMEYSKRTREVARGLMKGISMSLGLETFIAIRSNWLTSSLRSRPLDSSYP
ncbi:2-oxoglutarate-dependent dioxygenase 19-like [Juglans microcarpa x Juglans regia]|uniref:2-oxoglutarate-dependent dioxygenase 19-like n=1 Tax=Juglans microcarpa x Juglans regia TaxID=2249226 RepID=UPI001B7E15E7|nr:2-oxoglutarate-dependent dioxygenase 19-like [Juglans microcarpa x Juglans regia]